MRLQHSHRQRFILSQLVMKRAQINLWSPNFATGSVAWPHDTAIRASMMRHNSLSEELKDPGCIPGTCEMTRATPHCVAYSIAPKVPDNVRFALV
ncbi:MAG: hypothetical protein AUH08_08410 [Verrucomicrobia bacterium 13_2_20CM_54_12]|nr:MAG: hypothetical protein AUH08_08410 [Verrucomicrobia bacterium 13_2_20CM_54_12]PYL45990.1 MAG: hypothetical protein DME29_00150 [Verrucomicrobiota bacterium]